MKYIKLSMQIALLGQLLEKRLITDGEYEVLLQRTLKEYDVKCWDI